MMVSNKILVQEEAARQEQNEIKGQPMMEQVLIVVSLVELFVLWLCSP